MAFSHINSHTRNWDTISDDCVNVPEPAVATVLPSDVKNTEELDFDKTDVIALFKKKNSKVHIFVTITSSIPRPPTRVFHTGPGPNMVRTSFLTLKWRYCTWFIHKMSLKLASYNPNHVIGKAMLFLQLCDLHAGVPFRVVEILAVPLLVGTSFIDRFVKEIFSFDETPNCPYPLSSSCFCLGTYATVGSIGCITNWFGHWKQFKRPKGQ